MPKIFRLLALLFVLTAAGAPAVLARNETSVAPDGFCNGGIPWPLAENETALDPNCGTGTFQVDVEGELTPFDNFEDANNFRNSRAATYWFEPGIVATHLIFIPFATVPPMPAPDGFCNGGIPWPLAENETALDPNCGTGTFQVDVEGELTPFDNFEDANNFRNSRAATYWFEPTSQ